MNDWQLMEDVMNAANRIYLDAGYGIPADIQEIASYMNVEYYERLLPYRVNALYHRDEDGSGIVCVNNHHLKTETVRRQAGAHELGHHVIIDELGVRAVYLLTTSGCMHRRPAEEACDLFARCLLMPEPLFLAARQELGRPSKLAAHFGVKLADVRKRLEDLRL
ncbi:MAG: ImmA/IrrE family metallo-endopeptidase [Armatimonadota bacterium]